MRENNAVVSAPGMMALDPLPTAGSSADRPVLSSTGEVNTVVPPVEPQTMLADDTP